MKWKRFLRWLPALSVLLAAVTGCQQTYSGEGEPVEITREVGRFDKLVLSMDADLVVTDTGMPFCRVTAQRGIQDGIVTRLDGNTLIITTKGRLDTDRPVTISIGMSHPSAFEVNGSGSITGSNTPKNEKIDFEVNGSGNLAMDVVAIQVTGAITGSGHMKLNGSANDLKFEINGSGELDAAQFSTHSSKVKISGSGMAAIWADETMEAHVSGSGIVRYGGSAIVEKSVSGSGEVVKVD